MTKRWTLAFDADDTLWQNETFFRGTQAHFETLMAPFCAPEHLEQRLIAAERRNVARYGYGIKGFVLSMIETAVEVSEQRVSADVIHELLTMGKDMLVHPIDLLPGVEEVIKQFHGQAELIIITKGDLMDQERKVAQSGLGDYFDDIQIVSEKTADVYQRIFAKHDTARAMMIGNSLKSDILPALEAGVWATYIPHDLTWALEQAAEPENHHRFHRLVSMGELPELIERLS